MTTYQLIDHNKRLSFVLIILHVLVVVAIGWLLGLASDQAWGGLVIAVGVATISGFTGYFAGDKIALASAGAKEVPREAAVELHRIVENLSITAGIPQPRLYLIEDPAPNAFATGRTPETSSIAVTTGLLRTLDRNELEGVIAHEMAHIQNYDIRLMTLTAVLVGSVVLLSDFFLHGLPWRRRDSEEGGGGWVLILAVVVALLSPLIAQLIKFAMSRSREYLADATGAHLTRYPEGLASALEKIAQIDQPLQQANHATAHLFLANPFDPHVTSRFEKLWSTHPPIEDRIARLRSL